MGDLNAEIPKEVEDLAIKIGRVCHGERYQTVASALVLLMMFLSEGSPDKLFKSGMPEDDTDSWKQSRAG